MKILPIPAPAFRFNPSRSADMASKLNPNSPSAAGEDRGAPVDSASCAQAGRASGITAPVTPHGRLSLSILLPLCACLLAGQVYAAAPTLSTPLISVNAGSATLSLQSSETGTGYFTLLPGTGADCGSGTQIQAGTDSGDSAAYRIGSLPLTAATPAGYTVRNLAAASDYTVCFSADDGATLQTTAATANLTTSAMASLSNLTWGAVGSAGFSAATADDISLSFAPDGTPYLAYRDAGNSLKATVVKFSAGAWSLVGSAGFSAGQADTTSLSFAPDGTPYVAYSDYGNSGNATVMKFSAGSWSVVGSAGFSAGTADYLSLTFAPDGTPYVAYQDGSSYKATVMKFSAGTWSVVGSAGFSAGTANYLSLSFAPDGTPYVAYVDNGNSSKVTVMKFSAGSWSVVGSAGFSAGIADYTSLSFAPDGTPYVAYQDGGNGGKATVMKFTAGSWSVVGSAGFSAGDALYTSLSFAPDGTPYVAYEDYGNSGKATVMAFIAGSWSVVGSAGFSAGTADYTSLFFAPDGTPYVAYTDGGNSYKATVMKLVASADVTAPVLSAVGVSGATSSGATLAGTADEAATGYWIAVVHGSTAPSAAEVEAATTYGGITVVAGGNAAMTLNAAKSFTVGGLSASTAYTLYLIAKDAAGNRSLVSNVDVTTSAGVTAPTLSTPLISVNAGSATLSLQSSEIGTGYFTLLPGAGAACGTGAQIQAGQDSSGSAAYRIGSLPLTAATPASYTVRNLAAGSDYTACFSADDGTTLQATAATVNLTTAVMTSLGTTWSVVGNAGFSAGSTDFTSLSFAPDGTPYVAYMDEGNDYKATVMKFSAGAWSVVGSAGFSASTAGFTSLSFAPDGTPYVAYVDDSNSSKATVMKFSAGAWRVVGSAGFSAGATGFTSLSFAPDGAPYVAYVDDSNSYKVTVMKFSAGSWSVVGSAGFSAGEAEYLSLSFAPDGAPYVAYMDAGNGNKATLMKFSAGSWSVVGSAGFSSSKVTYTSLAFAPDGTPYVAYLDFGNGNKATVMKFSAGSWSEVGNAGLSASTAYTPSLSFAPDGTPYVAYVATPTYRATVKKFSAGSWSAVGSAAGFSMGMAGNTALSFAPDGTPYVAFQDFDNSGKATVMKLMPDIIAPGYSSASINSAKDIITLTFNEALINNLADLAALKGAITFAADGVNFSALAAGDSVAIVGSTVTVTFATPLNGTTNKVRIDANSLKDAADNVVTSVTTTGAVAGDITAPGYSSASLSGANSVVTLTFNEALVNNLADLAALKAAITFAADGVNFSALEAGDAVAIVGATVTLTFATPLTGATNKVRIDAASLKDAAGNVVTGVTTTNAMAANDIAAPSYSSALINGANTVITLTFDEAPLNNLADLAALKAAITFAADGVNFGALAAGDTVAIVGATVTVTFATPLTGTTNKLTIAANSLKDAAGNVMTGVTTTSAVAAPPPQPPSVTVIGVSAAAGGATLSLQSSETGTGYFTLLPGAGATCGTGAQTQSGQDSNGDAAYRFGSLPLTAGATANYTVRNLAAGSTYTVCFSADNNGANLQTTAATASLTTTAMVGLSHPTWSVVGSAGFSAGAMYTALVFAPDGAPYVAYQDAGNFPPKATVMKFSAGAWSVVGSAGFSAGQADFLSPSFAPDGTPYVAYRDFGNSSKATVMKFSAGAWSLVGSAGFSAGTVDNTSLSFALDGTPYVVYKDGGNANKATLMKFSAGAWSAVGSAGFSAGAVDNTSLSFAPDGAPHVVYKDGGNSNKATVMKFSAGAWSEVGSAGFSAGSANYTSLSFAPDGTPYVAYQDGGNSNKVTVMKFSAGTWSEVGSAGFSAGSANYTSLSFAPDGTPYVAYQDGGNSNKVTLMKYSAGTWSVVGSAGFSVGAAPDTSLSFAPDGTPYVAYVDYGSGGKATVMKLSANIGVPAAPTGVTATAGDAGVSVAFSAPADDGGAAIAEYTASCDTPNHFNTLAFSQSGSASPITVSGLSNGTEYQCLVFAKNSVGDGAYSSLSNRFTPAVAPVPAPNTNPSSNPTTLPTGGGTTTLSNGQSVMVTENGQNGTTINLPPPGQNSDNAVKLNLPGSGDVSIQSTVTNTRLGVTHVTLPGATVSVTTVTVDNGSATLTASKEGQALGGLKNGIVVVSGSSTSQVSVDSTGVNARIGIKGNDTLVVPSGSANVSGTSVDLPPPTLSGAAPTVKLDIGGQSLTIQSNQADTSMTFKVIDIGGVQTPVLAVTGSAQVTSSGEDKPLVSVAGNVLRSGSGSGGLKCNTVVEASSNSVSDAVHVSSCYIVLTPGSFSAMGAGRNGFAAIRDGIVWAGETAEFDKSGNVVSAYLGTKTGSSGDVGDDVVPGGNKFVSGEYRNNAFIPRLSGTPLRLNGAKLDESLFKALNQMLGTTTTPATPGQSAQGVMSFHINGDSAADQKAQSTLNFNLKADQITVIPTRRIRVDTSRADGVSLSSEGDVEVAAGGLVAIFAPSVGDPQVFAEKVAQALPGATGELRWNGTWKVITGDGGSYVGRPAWNRQMQTGNATFASLTNGNVIYHDGGYSQMLFADFHDYTTLQATFAKELKDAALTVLPNMDGTATAKVNGKTYTLTPQWKLVKTADGKPAWWLDNGVVYIKNADGTAQGFTVK